MNIQEQILRIQSMMGLIQEETLICKHCNERTKKNIETLSPEIKDKVIKFIDNVFTKFNKTLTVTDSFRSFDDQNKLYCQGRSKDEFCIKNKIPTTGNKVTRQKGGCSKHNYGEAFDVYFTTSNGIDLNTTMTEEIAKIAEDLGLEWGGRWPEFVDSPHFQSPGTLSSISVVTDMFCKAGLQPFEGT